MQRGVWQCILRVEPSLVTRIINALQHAEAICLLVYALDSNNEPLVRLLYSHPHLLLLGEETRKFASVLHCAAAYGVISVVQWLLRQSKKSKIPLHASRNDHLALVRDFQLSECATARTRVMAWVNRNTPYLFPAEVMYEAARQGDLEVVQWLHTTTQYESYRAMEYAGVTGKLEVIMWLFENRVTAIKSIKNAKIYMVVPLVDPKQSSNLEESTLEAVNWVTVFRQEQFFREAFATREGLLAPLYDQRDHKIDWQNDADIEETFRRRRYGAIDEAAGQGKLKLVKLLHQDPQWPCTKLAMDKAASNGHLDVVQWLHENRSEGSSTTAAMWGAAGNGHFEVVQWLHKYRNSGFRSLIMDVTAANGHLEILQWLYERYPRFRCSTEFLPTVAVNGHRHVLEWLHTVQGMTIDARTIEASIISGDFELFQWLLLQATESVVLTSGAVEKAAKSGSLPMIKWLVEERGLWSMRAMIAATSTGNIEIAKWLYAKEPTKHDLVDDATLFRCAVNGNYEFMKWLLQHQLVSPSLASDEDMILSTGEINKKKLIAAPATKQFAKRFAWDLHIRENYSYVQKYVSLVAQYYPEKFNVHLFPLWAAQRSDLFVLQQLAKCDPSNVFTKQTYHALVTYASNSDVMQWFFAHPKYVMPFIDIEMVQWAVRYEQITFLEYFFTTSLLFKNQLHFKELAYQHAIQIACYHGILDMLRWLSANCEVFFSICGSKVYLKLQSFSMWKDATVGAAARGHVNILDWIHSKFGIVRIEEESEKGLFIKQIVDITVMNGQLKVLQRIHQLLGADPIRKMSIEALRCAIVNRYVDIVSWIYDCDYYQTALDTLPSPERESLEKEMLALVENEIGGFIPTTMAYVFPTL